ncbi:DUF1345 domain-containing protein [Steroidobacter sp.]|uniref:DUF1345 domain-containing protein n=1 Tax=Steroidobacter sp. TaxID=1978227 RepID=UPI001A4D6206|nr:DUF1345 domain-containing protein [Steroidobacter sp.]MBL8266131.1 DUF1345 domain-containing protein [Steroidobacter sp.]
MPRFIARHSRLLISTGVACLLFLVLPAHWATITRVLVSWNVGVLLFLILVFQLMTGMNAKQISAHYRDEDPTAPAILIISVMAAILAMASIVALLATLNQLDQTEKSLHVALAAFTVIDAWILIPTMFTMHYADMFYGARPDARPLRFPDTDMPAFWDFMYFSFTIAAACQTADVSTTPGAIRKVLIAHSILSFFFNAAILGFAINVTAGLIGSQ